MKENIFCLNAHNKSCTELAVNFATTMFATSSLDKSIKIWCYGKGVPKLLVSKDDMKVGALYTVEWEGISGYPFLLLTGGKSKEIALWDLSDNKEVRKKFP